MTLKKLLLIALVATGFAFTSTPSQAGVSVGIGIGVPIGYPYPYYGYRGYPYPYYRPVVYVGPSFYWYHGHRVFFTRHHRRFHHW
jgi:hypothetical protein